MSDRPTDKHEGITSLGVNLGVVSSEKPEFANQKRLLSRITTELDNDLQGQVHAAIVQSVTISSLPHHPLLPSSVLGTPGEWGIKARRSLQPVRNALGT